MAPVGRGGGRLADTTPLLGKEGDLGQNCNRYLHVHTCTHTCTHKYILAHTSTHMLIQAHICSHMSIFDMVKPLVANGMHGK